MEIKFNWIGPREYKDSKTGEIKYALCAGNEKMNVDTLDFIQKYASSDKKPKEAQPWGQVFANGYRVVSNSLDYKDWNGITFSDVDSKWYYKLKSPFNVNNLFNNIAEWGPLTYEKNFYACHLTNSKQGFRIFWYWDCERTEENFIKCCILTEKYTKELFYSFGEKGKDIIDFVEDGHRVLDKCSNSVMQGFYVTTNEIRYSSHINDPGFGYIDLSDIDIEQAYQSGNVTKIVGDFDQKKWCKIIEVKEVDKDSIKYYPHQHRRCIYEALCMLYDGEELDNQWSRICKLMPEGNGHDYDFYYNEPNKDKWNQKISNDVIHDLHWLDDFGYVYENKIEYIYHKQFKKSWKKYIRAKMIASYINFKSKQYDEESGKGSWDDLDKDAQEELIAGWKDKVVLYNIFDKSWDKEFNDKEAIEKYRADYWKDRWEPKDFVHLCDGYEIPRDIVTYKMYADFYYRDKNNLPLLKYDCLEDEIYTIGYWPETDKIQWHAFKYGNEYTHWKNNDTFSNKCTKSDLTEAINKFVPRWFTYHSIKDYLNSLDLSTANEELLETWAIRYFKADDTPLTRTICKNFFIAAVKKMMIQDPTKFVFQHMLFLHGKTGCGKTTFLVTMFTIDGHSYVLNKIDPNAKDNEIGPLIAKNWLIQFGENEGMDLKKVSVNAAKEFVDRINLGMKYQKKYENEQTTIYPRILACKTSNDEILFNDVSVGVDRRNWLIECNVPENWWEISKSQEKLEAEKDILWATAYKLYLDDQNKSLELPNELFIELGNLQEKHKLVTLDDINEVYKDLFERYFMTDSKKQIMDETSFLEQAKRSDELLDKNLITTTLDTDILLSAQDSGRMPSGYTYKNKIDRLPIRWVKSFVIQKYGLNTYKLFYSNLSKFNLEVKSSKYHGTVTKCLIK